jgi:hypothetical protein
MKSDTFLAPTTTVSFFSLCASMTNNGETDNVDLSMDETLLDIRELPSARVSGSGGRIR